MVRVYAIVWLMLGLVGCGQEAANPPASENTPTTAPVVEATVDAVKIKALKLGKSVDQGHKVAADTVGFSKDDTVYAGVELAGKGSAHLKAVWTHLEGDKVSVVEESEQTVEAMGDTAIEFHVSNPSGWPSGDYKVEVKLNDTFSETKSFSVSE